VSQIKKYMVTAIHFSVICNVEITDLLTLTLKFLTHGDVFFILVVYSFVLGDFRRLSSIKVIKIFISLYFWFSCIIITILYILLFLVM
jgi:hypothetical protein